METVLLLGDQYPVRERTQIRKSNTPRASLAGTSFNSQPPFNAHGPSWLVCWMKRYHIPLSEVPLTTSSLYLLCTCLYFSLCTSNIKCTYLFSWSLWRNGLDFLFSMYSQHKHSACSVTGIQWNFLSPKLLISIPKYNCLPSWMSCWRFKVHVLKTRPFPLPAVIPLVLYSSLCLQGLVHIRLTLSLQEIFIQMEWEEKWRKRAEKNMRGKK